MNTHANDRLLAARTVAIADLVMSATAAGQTPDRSRTEGLKETDRFIKTGGSTSHSVGTAKLEGQS